MVDNADFFREQLMRAASIHGGAVGPGPGQVLTQKSIDTTIGQEQLAERLNLIVQEAIGQNAVAKDDKVFALLTQLFLSKANTAEGKEKAIRMAIWVTKELNKYFEVSEKNK